jgi:hypothetical protein
LSTKGTGQKKSPHKHYVPEVEKVDATGLFLVVLHEVGLYVAMMDYGDDIEETNNYNMNLA